MRMPLMISKALAAPETNLFLFAFLLNFVYEVWQSPFYEFYSSPSFGDGMIILFSSWVVSILRRSRYWLLKPGRRLTVLFTGIGLLITLVLETFRVNVSRSYGVPVFAVPILGMSALAVVQWITLPPLILYLARRHMLGYSGNDL